MATRRDSATRSRYPSGSFGTTGSRYATKRHTAARCSDASRTFCAARGDRATVCACPTRADCPTTGERHSTRIAEAAYVAAPRSRGAAQLRRRSTGSDVSAPASCRTAKCQAKQASTQCTDGPPFWLTTRISKSGHDHTILHALVILRIINTSPRAGTASANRIRVGRSHAGGVACIHVARGPRGWAAGVISAATVAYTGAPVVAGISLNIGTTRSSAGRRIARATRNHPGARQKTGQAKYFSRHRGAMNSRTAPRPIQSRDFSYTRQPDVDKFPQNRCAFGVQGSPKVEKGHTGEKTHDRFGSVWSEPPESDATLISRPCRRLV